MPVYPSDQSRDAALAVLHSHSVPWTTWYEHALRFFGSKTIVFDLHLLVPSPAAACSYLLASNESWARAEMPPLSSQHWDLADQVEVLARNGATDFRVVLMPEADWGRPRRRIESQPATAVDGCPILVDFYAALARRYIHTSSTDFRRYLSVQIAYLYMGSTELSTPAFAAQLPLDVLQFHYDMLADKLAMLAEPTIAHERWIARQVEQGEWEFMPQGSDEVGGKRRDLEMEQYLRDLTGYGPYPTNATEETGPDGELQDG